MARSSGRLGPAAAAIENFDGASFSVAGTDCKMSPAPSGFLFEFSRREPAVSASRALDWFIGSGHVGRNYLYARDGFLFQAPISYYSLAGRFAASPGYQQKPTIELTRPVTTACLQCHASRLQPVAGTANRFGAEPFLEGGVSCERCHGPGQQHVERAGQGVMVNPAKLPPARRDSICAQCHLTGAARVARVDPAQRYRPGDRLSDSIAVFVWGGSGAAATSATNHFEQLASSACQRVAGAKLWCRTCHPVHGKAVEVKTVCLGCHVSSKHKEENDGNCTACHMPRRVTEMGDHVAYTDHSIARRPRPADVAPARVELRPFGGAKYDARDLALAYASAGVGAKALELLEKAAAQSPQDTAVLLQLAQLHDRAGQEEKAVPLYERVLRLDPGETTAAINLGGSLMKRSRTREAMALWESALRRNPGLIEARLNLAVARFRAGERDAALAELKLALEWEPDHAVARQLLDEVTRAGR